MLNLNGKVTSFFPYESLRPSGYILKLEYSHSDNCIRYLKKRLIEECLVNGIKAYEDNKIGFEIRNTYEEHESVLRIVFWDSVCYIIPVTSLRISGERP